MTRHAPIGHGPIRLARLLLAPLLLALPSLAAAAGPAATPPPAPAPAPAKLFLSATGEAAAAPDLLDAALAATADGADPARVQSAVNAASGHAADLARAVPGVVAGLAGYGMDQDEHRLWHGTATLTLESRDGAALLALVGRLQAAGLALVSLEWRLSPALRASTLADAERQAIEQLRVRGLAAADTLGLRLAGLAELRLDDGGGGFRPMAMARVAGPVAPPDLNPAQKVEATATATLLLLPR